VPKTNIQIIDPTKHKSWDELLKTNPSSSFFHTSGWAKVLTESYGYKPLYFTQIDNGKLTGLLAVMEVNSYLTGKRGVSLPFTDHCPVIAKNQKAFDTLLDKAIDHGRKNGWKTLGIRGGESFLQKETASESFLIHELKLDSDEKALLSKFRSSTRRNIKKAKKQAVTVKSRQTPEAMHTFYRLNCLTRKDHGLPPQPSIFFDNVQRHIISKDNGVVMLASFKDETIASAVYFHHGEGVMYKYGASNKKYQQLRANNLVMWDAVKAFAAAGSKNFDFGRTELEHTGLLQFKRGWGTTEKLLYYYKYDFKKDAFVAEASSVKSSYAVFRNMPIPMLKLAGRILYKHIG